jgi:hypothetical protein
LSYFRYFLERIQPLQLSTQVWKASENWTAEVICATTYTSAIISWAHQSIACDNFTDILLGNAKNSLTLIASA